LRWEGAGVFYSGVLREWKIDLRVAFDLIAGISILMALLSCCLIPRM